MNKESYQEIFSIDGQTFNIRIPQDGIKRSASVLDTDETERLQSGGMFRDIIGTYLNYTITIDTSLLDVESYDALYEILISPVKSHTITVPYGQTTVTLEIYVSNVEDTLKRRELNGDNTKNFWHGLSVVFTSNDPFIRALE